jgi:tetratricopeptide (TPR) repeat protein
MSVREHHRLPSGCGPRLRSFIGSLALCLCLGLSATSAAVPDIATGLRLLDTGRYAEADAAVEAALKEDASDEEWTLLKVRLQLITGRYGEALGVVTNGFRRYPLSTSIRLRLLARDVFRFTGQPDKAEQAIVEINRLAGSRSWAYRDAVNVVTLGQAALELGADPKLVLDRLFTPAIKAEETLKEGYLAIGELALAKGNYQLAADHFKQGLKHRPEDPDLLHGLARAYAEGATPAMLEALKQALSVNENHVPAKLLVIDHLIDGEDYEESEKLLKEVLAINPWQPMAWAYRAVIAHVKNQPGEERSARAKALKHYSNNPEVDHLIGRKLSQKYRFREGAEYQRQALKLDGNHLPAKLQLAQDLLRIGEEADGWKLAEEVHEKDGFDVTAFNLMTLKDSTEKYVALTNARFILRMEAREAGIWGDRALALLDRAHAALTKKYAIELPQRTTVEIFASQNDFAVRTFGATGNPGFLGVCFGPLITANSPSTQGDRPSNWEAVLWHEFAHVITLTKTRNKMPRWLSEGISVYEELAENPSWGQRMTPRYVQLIEDGDLTPVSRLSLAFMRPKTPEHLQFAYYEAYLVVEYLVREFGQEKLRRILDDLGKGDWINVAIARHCRPMDEIDREFESHVRRLADELAPGLDFSDPEKPKGLFGGAPLTDASGKALDLRGTRDRNYFLLSESAMNAIKEEDFEAAMKSINLLLEHYPLDISPVGGLRLKSLVHRKQGESEAERKTLVRLALLTNDTLDVYSRLMELEAARTNWTAVKRFGERYLAVQPLRPLAYERLAEAAEHLDDARSAVAAWEKVLQLDPPDPAGVHYRLGRQLSGYDAAGARRHVLMALEEAPRFRDAHRLLLELNRKGDEKP